VIIGPTPRNIFPRATNSTHAPVSSPQPTIPAATTPAATLLPPASITIKGVSGANATAGLFGVPGYSSCDIQSAPIFFDTRAFTHTVCKQNRCSVTVEPPGTLQWSPPNNCCYACGIRAEGVRLIYWSPEATITPPPATPVTVVSNGFTL